MSIKISATDDGGFLVSGFEPLNEVWIPYAKLNTIEETMSFLNGVLRWGIRGMTLYDGSSVEKRVSDDTLAEAKDG